MNFSEAKYATNTMSMGAIETRLLAVGFVGQIIHPYEFDDYDVVSIYHEIIAHDIKVYKKHFECDPQVDYLFIDSDVPNALCTIINGRYLIVISVALIEMILNLITVTLMSGKVDLVFDQLTIAAQIRFLVEGGEIGSKYNEDSADKSRLQYLSGFITRLSIIFIIGHEMTHICNGHLALNKHNFDSILENCLDVQDSNNILRSMENDADLFAIYQTIGLVTQPQTTIFDTGIIADIETCPTKRIKCAILGIFVCLNLFDCLHPSSIASATTHPSHYDRALFTQSFIVACLTVMLREKNSSAEIDRKELVDLMLFARVSAMRISGRKFDFSTFGRSVNDETFSAEADQRFNAWRGLGAALQDHQLSNAILSSKIRNFYKQ